MENCEAPFPLSAFAAPTASPANAASIAPKTPKTGKRIPLHLAQKNPPPAVVTTKRENLFNEIHRIASALWSDESIPFKLYEVQKRPAQILDVHVVRGKGIAKGWFRDIMDGGDPYLLLRIPGTPNGVKRTKTVKNKKNPLWDEHFIFYIDPFSTPTLEIKLIDSLYIVDKNMGVATIGLDKITVEAGLQYRELVFNNNSKAYITLHMREATEEPDVRVGQALSEEERAFLEKRRDCTTLAMEELLRDDEWGRPRSCQEAPCVAVLGSGGGFRATAGFAGALKALHDAGVLSCVTYVAGVSGSTWYMSYLYAQKDHAKLGPGAFEAVLRERMCSGWRRLLLPRNLCRYLAAIARKASAGQPVAFTDLFGHLVGDTLLGEEAKQPLSVQRAELEEAEAPLPVYACVHVNRDISAQVFQEWITFTPYDVSLDKYAASIKTELFGSKMYCGFAIKKFPEPPMSFLLGLWGSAFSILFKRLVWDRQKKGSYFAYSTAEADEEAAADMLSTRAAREGYASSNNVTGSSNDSLQMRTTDEVSTEEEPEETRRLREAAVEEQLQEALRKEEAARARRRSKASSSRESKVSAGSRPSKVSAVSRASRASNVSKITRSSRVSNVSKISRPSRASNVSKIPRQSKTYSISTTRKSRKSIRKSLMPSDRQSFSDRSEWIQKRKERTFRTLIMAKRAKRVATQRGFWRRVFDMLLSEGLFDTRTGRAGLVFNPLRGLTLRPTFPRDLEETVTAKDTEPLKGLYVQADPRFKRWFVVDGGLALNLPFPPMLRPQRGVDVFIVFDFSSRPADDASPFSHLLLAEEWARRHDLRFPPVREQVERFLHETPRECYYFRDTTDPVCPVVLFFPLINLSFREFKTPGVHRTAAADIKMGDFNIFSDVRGAYSVTNFHYSTMAFDRLVRLMEYNVLQNLPMVTSVLRSSVVRKHSLLPPEAPDEKTMAALREAETREALRQRREQRRRENALKRKERLLMARRSSEREEEILRKRKKMPWDRRHPLPPPAPHYTHELADELYNAADVATTTDTKAPITELLNAAFKAASETARAVTGRYRPKKKRDATPT